MNFRKGLSILMLFAITATMLAGCTGSGSGNSSTNTTTQPATSTSTKKDIKWEELSLEEKIKCYKDEFGIDVPQKTLNFKEMQKQVCKDIYAWLYIPEIKIDTPIVQHPSDDEYYLNYNIDGSKGYPGGVYTEPSYNKKNFSDRHTIVYGRTMRVGSSSFTPLHELENKGTFDSTRYMFVYTEDDILVYYIIAAREVTSQHLLDNAPRDDETWVNFLKSILDSKDISGNGRNNYVESYDFSKDTKLLTLCTALKDNDEKYRYNVFGVLVR